MKYSALLAIRCTYPIKNPVHRIGHSRRALLCFLMPMNETHKTPQMINLQGFAVYSSYFCGRRGIRTPGTLQFNGFQDRRDRPLRHPSGHKSSTDFPFRQIFTPIYHPYRRTENQIRTIIFVFIRNLHIFVSELGPRGYFLHATML